MKCIGLLFKAAKYMYNLEITEQLFLSPNTFITVHLEGTGGLPYWFTFITGCIVTHMRCIEQRPELTTQNVHTYSPRRNTE